MNWRFWKRKPRNWLVCQWGQTRGQETCDGSVAVYDCVDKDGERQDKTRTLCQLHKREKSRDLVPGWKLVKRP